MEKKPIQYRGHCQFCGRVQAVPSAYMSKHGYKVEGEKYGGYAYFVGVCQGERYEPMEVSIVESMKIVVAVKAQAVELWAKRAALESGEKLLKGANVGERIPTEGKQQWEWPKAFVPWAEMKSWDQESLLSSKLWELKCHAEGAERFAEFIEKTANESHGKPLLEVSKDAGPAPILAGERRKGPRGVYVAQWVERGQVNYLQEGSNESRCWQMSSRSWRLLPLA